MIVCTPIQTWVALHNCVSSIYPALSGLWTIDNKLDVHREGLELAMNRAISHFEVEVDSSACFAISIQVL